MDWISYREKISHSTDASESIRWRMEFLLRNLLERFPNLSRKDNQRDFTHVQKLAIFRRDKGVCQVKLKCQGRENYLGRLARRSQSTLVERWENNRRKWSGLVLNL